MQAVVLFGIGNSYINHRLYPKLACSLKFKKRLIFLKLFPIKYVMGVSPIDQESS